MLKQKLIALVDAVAHRMELVQRTSSATKCGQRTLQAQWKLQAAVGKPPVLSEVGFRVFSQFEEDGQLLFIFSMIGETNRTFVDIGSGDGVNSNCANLALNHGWWGLFCDGNPDNIDSGRRFYSKHADAWAYRPEFVCDKVTRENVDSLIRGAGIEGEIDLLSIDIDGNDYWVWDAIESVSPRVVIVETHVEFGMHPVVVPYDPH